MESAILGLPQGPRSAGPWDVTSHWPRRRTAEAVPAASATSLSAGVSFLVQPSYSPQKLARIAWASTSLVHTVQGHRAWQGVFSPHGPVGH